MSEAVYIGVDCGGTNLRVAAAEASGIIVAERSVPTGDAQDRENGLGEAIVALVESLVMDEPVKGHDILGVGVGLPFVCWEGKAHLCRNVRVLDPVWLDERLEGRYGAPAALTNDVKCAALGEAWRGAARGADPFLYLNVGTGLSTALFTGGRIYQGAHHAAGEIAYWVTEAAESGGLADGFGPLEEAMSGVGITGAYRRASPHAENLSAEEIFGRAERGEVLASAIVEKGIEYLLPAIANLLTFADPELLVIGGGVAGSLVRYTARIEAYVARMTPFPPRLAWSTLKGRAGLIGAIRLAVLESLGTP